MERASDCPVVFRAARQHHDQHSPASRGWQRKVAQTTAPGRGARLTQVRTGLGGSA